MTRWLFNAFANASPPSCLNKFVFKLNKSAASVTRCKERAPVGTGLCGFCKAIVCVGVHECVCLWKNVCCLFFQISSKDEDFLDLSVDVEQNTSITHCLR